jgi:hypothetical protein
MANRTGSRHTITLYDAGSWTRLTSPGYGHRDVVADAIHESRACYSLIEPPSGTRGYGKRKWASVLTVPGGDLEPVICRPFLWAEEAAKQTAEWWQVSTNSSWQEVTSNLYGETMFFQEDGTASQLTWAESEFTLPPNPIFAVSLWRGECSEDHDHDAEPLYTEIQFGEAGGGAQYAVFIPYSGDGIELMQRNVATGEVTALEPEGGNKLRGFEGLPFGQREFIWVACIGWTIYISTDGFGADTVAYTIQAEDYTEEGQSAEAWYRPHVFRGPVKLLHNAGQWAFTLWPIRMVPATVRSRPYYFAYRVADNSNAVNVTGWGEDVVDDPPDAEHDPPTVQSPTYSVVDSYTGGDTWEAHRAWKCVLTPVLCPHTISAGVFKTYTSPAAGLVWLYQNPLVETQTGPTGTDISDDVAALRIEWGEGNRAAVGGIELRNTSGLHKTVQSYQPITVSIGYDFDDDSDNEGLIFFGYVVNPGHNVRVAGLENADLVLYDPLIRLREMKAYGTEPDFMGLEVAPALRWIFLRNGIHLSQMSISGGTKTLQPTDAEEPRHGSDRWLPAFGAEWMDFVEDICNYDGESDWYCRPDATVQFVIVKEDGPWDSTSVDWALDEDSEGEEYQVFEVRRDQRPMDDSAYANTVVVRGRDANGNALDAMTHAGGSQDTSSVNWGGGWAQMRVIEDAALGTQAAVTERCLKLLDELSRSPEYIEVETNVLPGVHKGQVFSLTGAEDGKVDNAGARNKKYRIIAINVALAWERKHSPRMVLTGRYIGDIA